MVIRGKNILAKLRAYYVNGKFCGVGVGNVVFLSDKYPIYGFLQLHMCITIILQQNQQEVQKATFKKSGWVTQFLSVKIEMLAESRTLLFGQKYIFTLKTLLNLNFRKGTSR